MHKLGRLWCMWIRPIVMHNQGTFLHHSWGNCDASRRSHWATKVSAKAILWERKNTPHTFSAAHKSIVSLPIHLFMLTRLLYAVERHKFDGSDKKVEMHFNTFLCFMKENRSGSSPLASNPFFPPRLLLAWFSLSFSLSLAPSIVSNLFLMSQS